MHYLRVEWLGAGPEDPKVLYSELDEEGWEIRKVELFPDGHFGFAGAGETASGTQLGDQRVPPFEEIAADGEFRPSRITAEEFERVWDKRRGPAATQAAG